MAVTIQQLKRVTLSLIAASAGSATAKDTLAGRPVNFEFIHGVASDGLCPFETMLLDKAVGESLATTVAKTDARLFFGHLFFPLLQTLAIQAMPDTISLQVEVTAVADADNREVVQSLAKALAGGGCGGSCGCGC